MEFLENASKKNSFFLHFCGWMKYRQEYCTKVGSADWRETVTARIRPQRIGGRPSPQGYTLSGLEGDRRRKDTPPADWRETVAARIRPQRIGGRPSPQGYTLSGLEGGHRRKDTASANWSRIAASRSLAPRAKARGCAPRDCSTAPGSHFGLSD